MLFRGRHRTEELSLSRTCSIALLAVALVGAQMAGVAHRIEHAPGLGGQASQWHAPLQQDHDDHSPAHDCAAYDAAAVGDGPPLAQSAWTFDPPPQSVLATLVVAVADRSPHLPFHSRAPPRA